MAMLTVEDLSGKCDAVVFPRTFDALGELLKAEEMVFLRGTVDRRRERPNIIVEDVIPIDRAIEQLTGQVTVRLGGAGLAEEVLQRTREVLERHRGNCPVLFELAPPGQPDVRTTVRPDTRWFVQPSRKLVDDIEDLLGQENLLLTPKPNENGNGGGNGRRAYRKPALQRS